jgi:hypothetical protein
MDRMKGPLERALQCPGFGKRVVKDVAGAAKSDRLPERLPVNARKTGKNACGLQKCLIAGRAGR